MNNNIKTFLKYLNEIYLGFLGILWISFYIYIRFYIKRNPYALEDLKTSFTTFNLFLQLAFVLLHLITIITIVYVLLAKHKRNDFYIVEKLKVLFDFLFTKPLIYVRDTISPHIPGSGLFYCYFMAFLEKSEINPETSSKVFTIIFYAFPRIFVSLLFAIEIIVYNRIYYFIPSLFLLIIPLFWTIFVNLFTDFGKRIIRDMPKVIHVSPIGDILNTGFYEKYSFERKPEKMYNPEDFEEYIDTWRICLLIFSYGESFLLEFKNKISPYVTLFCSSCYLMGIIYKLLFLIII